MRFEKRLLKERKVRIKNKIITTRYASLTFPIELLRKYGFDTEYVRVTISDKKITIKPLERKGGER